MVFGVKKYVLFVISMMIGIALMAQKPPISHLEINHVRPTILGDGTCYYPSSWDPSSEVSKSCLSWEVPVDSGKETLRQHALWFGGLDPSGALHLSAMQYGLNGQDYWMGPLKVSDASTDMMTTLRFHHVWSLTRAEIDQFIENHNHPGYQIPEDILSWPAHGDDGYADPLAPFVDVNGDGHYNPVDGDYPDIKGDQCLFFIFNDGYGYHTETHGAKNILEVHGMVYAFDAPDDEALNNTVFVNYKFFNRAPFDYHGVYLGLWNDWDIGFENDDYVGCDVQRNCCYAYNGMPSDGHGEAWSYGDNPPVQVCAVLSSPDGLGMSGFVCHDNGNGSTGAPQNALGYYNLLRGCWRDGTPIQYGGNGHPDHPQTVGPTCRYMYPRDSDPENVGTGYVAPNGGYNSEGVYWTEEHEGIAPGNRMGLASVGPFDFPAYSMKELDYAMITVWKDDSHLALERMGDYVDHIRVFFDGYAHKKIKFVKDGTNLKIRSRLSDDRDILVTMYLRNGNTTFKDFYVGDKTLGDAELASVDHVIRSINDMVGPVGVATFWALYAQHGWSIPKMLAEDHLLDDQDIGSIWADQNGCRFVIGNISGDYIYLLPEITMDENGIYRASWNANLEYPTTLTHIEGATHILSITGISSRHDRPIQQVDDRRIYIDEREITDDGVYYCNQLKIQEHILGYNIGKVETWFPVPEYNGSLIDFDRTFEFSNGMNVTCNTTLHCKYPFVITNYRSIQPQFPLQKDQYHSFSFIPKIQAYYDDHRIDMPFNSDEGTYPRINVSRTAQQLYDVDKQPERCVTYLKNDAGQYLVGMAGGCSLTRGLSMDSIRNINNPVGYHTIGFGGDGSVKNKFYPKLMNTRTFDASIDTSFVAEVSGYYSWFDPGSNDCFVYYYKDDGDFILYIHAFEAGSKVRINLPTFMDGMMVDDIIEKTTGVSLLTERVVGGRLYAAFDTDDNLANYIVVKLKPSWN